MSDNVRSNRQRRGPLEKTLVMDMSEPKRPELTAEQTRKARERKKNAQSYRKAVYADPKIQQIRAKEAQEEIRLQSDEETEMYKRFSRDPTAISLFFQRSKEIRETARFCGLLLEDLLPARQDRTKDAFRSPNEWSKNHRKIMIEEYERRRLRNLKLLISNISIRREGRRKLFEKRRAAHEHRMHKGEEKIQTRHRVMMARQSKREACQTRANLRRQQADERLRRRAENLLSESAKRFARSTNCAL